MDNVSRDEIQKTISCMVRCASGEGECEGCFYNREIGCSMKLMRYAADIMNWMLKEIDSGASGQNDQECARQKI